MANIRRGYSDDFVLKNGRSGIGSSSPQETLDVDGVVKGQEFKTVGVSSFTGYEGFLNSNHTVTETVSVDGGASLSGEIIVGTGVTVTGAGSTAGQGAIDSLKVYNTFNPPVGGTEERPIKAKPGQLYYNQDFKTIEFWDGNNWRQVDNTTTTGRAIIGGGGAPGTITNIEYFNMSSQGNGVDFGDISFSTPADHGGCANNVRGLFAGNNPYGTPIDYITMASGGNSITFGTLTTGRRLNGTGNANSQRAVFPGGGTPGSRTVTMDTVNISQVANSVDFGDMATAVTQGYSYTTPTRGFYCGGKTPAETPSVRPDVQVFSMASNGTATEFGDIISRRGDCGGCNNQTKGIVFCGVGGSSAEINTIESLTISTLGNATDFGEMLESFQQGRSASSNTRAFSMSGRNSGTNVNIIAHVNFASSGNAIDFGDLSIARHAAHAFSDSHGGLGGF